MQCEFKYFRFYTIFSCRDSTGALPRPVQVLCIKWEKNQLSSLQKLSYLDLNLYKIRKLSKLMQDILKLIIAFRKHKIPISFRPVSSWALMTNIYRLICLSPNNVIALNRKCPPLRKLEHKTIKQNCLSANIRYNVQSSHYSVERLFVCSLKIQHSMTASSKP